MSIEENKIQPIIFFTFMYINNKSETINEPRIITKEHNENNLFIVSEKLKDYINSDDNENDIKEKVEELNDYLINTSFRHSFEFEYLKKQDKNVIKIHYHSEDKEIYNLDDRDVSVEVYL